jgi:23S rRNA pseudouridine2457 synthase
MLHYYKIWKPYGMLSQFTREAGHPSLADLGFEFPKDVYPVGRLDHDSEGLLLLTNDSRLNKSLLDPHSKTRKVYWVQVEGIPDDEALQKMKAGLTINRKGNRFLAKAAAAKRMSPPAVTERNPPVNYAKHPVTSWVEITITEGKNRQVRRMTAAVGHPTLRLIRFAMDKTTLEEMKPGEVKEISLRDLRS